MNNATGSDPGYGGGIYATSSSAPILADCALTYNQAQQGGGIATENADVTLEDCTFEQNTARESYEGGGAIAVMQGNGTATGCTFDTNFASRGGAIECSSYGHMSISQCSFSANEADCGGAVCSQLGGWVSLDDCAFAENQGAVAGGGLYVSHAFASATACSFTSNYSDEGGGINAHACALIVRQSTFISNWADTRGGALDFEQNADSLLVESCTLAGNMAPLGCGIGCVDDAEPLLEQTLIAFGTGGEAIYCGMNTSGPLLSCCDIYGNLGGDWTGCIAGQYGVGGNICEDPLFCGLENPQEPYTLHANSPCAAENNPACGQIGAWPIGCGGSSDVANEPGALPDVLMSRIHPNPFEHATLITYALPSGAGERPVVVRIYDSNGRMVRNLASAPHHPGWQSLSWDGTNQQGARAAAGVYFLRLQAGSQTQTRQVVLAE
jgi:predicted outer membrane repeat protein